jgi:hypothetical protein
MYFVIAVGTPQAAAAVLQPLPFQQAVVQPGALQTPPHHSPARQPLQQQQACAGSPATPAAAQQAPLDLNDPYTPWLRTSRKAPLTTPAAGGLTHAAMFTADLQLSSLSGSPAYSTSSSLNSSPGRSIAASGSSGPAHAADALTSLCDAVADLQLRQEASNPAVVFSTAGGAASPRAHAAAAAAAVAAPGPQDTPPAIAAGSALPPLCPGLLPTHLHSGSSQAATPANTAVLEAASSSDDDAGPLTLGRRTQPRVFRRPMLMADTDTSSSSGSSSGGSSSSDDEAEQCSSTGHVHKHPGSCGRSSTHRCARISVLTSFRLS